MRQKARGLAFLLLAAIGAASQCAQAANLTVNCDNKQTIRQALRLLEATNPQGPNKITVSGSCKGNFVIKSMDRLTLITKNGYVPTVSAGIFEASFFRKTPQRRTDHPYPTRMPGTQSRA